jgi:hypothetical protein
MATWRDTDVRVWSPTSTCRRVHAADDAVITRNIETMEGAVWAIRAMLDSTGCRRTDGDDPQPPLSPWRFLAEEFPSLQLTESFVALLAKETRMSLGFWRNLQTQYAARMYGYADEDDEGTAEEPRHEVDEGGDCDP